MDPSRKVTLRTNYFKFSWSVPILKYKIDTQPQVPSTQVGLLYRILSRLREPLGKLLETYQPFNFMIYSPTQAEESEFNVNYENVDYKITLRPSGILDPNSGDKEALVFMGRFFKLLQSQLKLKQVGRKYFDDKNGSEFGQWKLTVWPGYQTSLNQYQSQLLINIDTCFKVVRETTVLEFIEDLMSRYQGNQEKINEEIGGMTVMTRYNNTLYAISEVDFSRSPRSTFQMRDGKEISFAEYYETKYNKKLRDGQQPLLVHKRKKDGNPIFLIPELCVLTGQSNEMRQNFQLQKDLAKMIKPNPQKRLEESQYLLTLLSQNEKTKEMLKKWSVTPEVDPVKVTGTKIDAGTIILGHGQEFSLEATPDFDRKIQTEMLEQRPLQRIGVFYSSRDREALTAFMDTLKKCVETFNYPMDAPREFAIDGRNYNDWERVFKKELNPTVQAVILILPGKKKSAPFYDDCKRFLLTECPIPSQVVLTSTISAGKNLRSIVNKILIQICAKVGGTPWSISNFPLTDKPTTVIGIDVFHKTAMRKDSLLAYCATMNRHLSRYWSTINQHGPGEELGSGIQLAVKESLIQFKEVNGIYPQRLIVFRDGVAESQRKTLAEIEVKAFHRVFDDLISYHQMDTRPEFIFLCVNKRINSKFYTGDLAQQDGLKNPDQGTVIAQDITTNRDFYLISQKTTQGSATPTHYYILSYCIEEDGMYSEKAENMSDDMKSNIEMLTYKLCYMYYNWTGAIRIPAPIQYAHKLSNLIGDRWKPHQPMIPHKAFENYKSLYFI